MRRAESERASERERETVLVSTPRRDAAARRRTEEAAVEGEEEEVSARSGDRKSPYVWM